MKRYARLWGMSILLGAIACAGWVFANGESGTGVIPREDTRVVEVATGKSFGIFDSAEDVRRILGEPVEEGLEEDSTIIRYMEYEGLRIIYHVRSTMLWTIRITEPTFATSRGISVGARSEEIREVYGIEPHSAPGGYYFMYTEPQHKRSGTSHDYELEILLSFWFTQDDIDEGRVEEIFVNVNTQ